MTSAASMTTSPGPDDSAPMKIAYLVHDLGDAAVKRRLRMFASAGADVMLIGFRRSSAAPRQVEGFPVFDLGQTHDAGLLHRAISVLRHVLSPGKIRKAIRDCDVILARNLESLALAARLRPSAPLGYECLDIHRSLLGKSFASRIVQRIESALLARAALLITSSPAFVTQHFAKASRFKGEILLVENKLLALGGPAPAPAAKPASPPWVVGWFGMLRCRRSLEVLSQIAREAAGQIEILIAGKPSPAEFRNFAQDVAAMPHVTYVGPYNSEDLPALYARCHFAWTIDWFEEGLNSAWLLPNRLYESSAFGVVPIALANVEVGRWLKRREAGLLLTDSGAELGPFLASLRPDGYDPLREAVLRIPRRDLIAEEGDCTQLIAALRRIQQ